jgi:hypothetical protein
MSDSEPVSTVLETPSEPAVPRITLTQFMNEFDSYMTWVCSQTPTTILVVGVLVGYLNGSLIALMIPRTVSYLLGLMSGIVSLASGYVVYSIDVPKERFNQLRSLTVTCMLLSVLLFLKSVVKA